MPQTRECVRHDFHSQQAAQKQTDEMARHDHADDCCGEPFEGCAHAQQGAKQTVRSQQQSIAEQQRKDRTDGLQHDPLTDPKTSVVHQLLRIDRAQELKVDTLRCLIDLLTVQLVVTALRAWWRSRRHPSIQAAFDLGVIN